MANFIAVVLAGVAAYAGLYLWPLLAAAAVGVVAVLAKSDKILAAAAVAALAGLYGTTLSVQSWGVAAACLVAIHLAGSTAHKEGSATSAWLWVPMALCSAALLLRGHWFVGASLLPLLAVFVPGFNLRWKAGGRAALVAATIAAGLALAGAAWWATNKNAAAKIAYLDGGKWARTSPPYTLEGLNIAASYSYSELASLLGAEDVEVAALTNGYSEAWFVTPTKPLSDVDADHLNAWVRGGGHLIAVADHTDLYGHVKVLNDLLKRMGCSVEAAAIFSGGAAEEAVFGNGNKAPMLTPTATAGRLAWPIASVRGYLEQAYYGRNNFFGPLSPSKDDDWARWAVLSKTAHGKGQLTVLGDSTVLANFAVYLPGVADLIDAARKTYPVVGALWLLYASVGAAVAAAAMGSRVALALVAVLPATMVLSLPGAPLIWGKTINWSGDRAAVSLGLPASRSFATAYSIAALSGMKPRWLDNADANGGVWVSETKPPSPAWRHLTAKVLPDGTEQRVEPAYAQLVEAVGGGNSPRDWSKGITTNEAIAGRVWTDDAMGNWWFDRGLSPAREERFRALMSWLHGKPLPSAPQPAAPTDEKQKRWRLKVDGRPEERVIFFSTPPEASQPVYLGGGVSGQTIKGNDTERVIGLSSWQEMWRPPKMWVATEEVE
jgi:hypothetical protein